MYYHCLQVVERVDRLIFVRPLKTRYEAAQGDVVVGRVTEVGGVMCDNRPAGHTAAGAIALRPPYT
jgi:hypothetical protein